MTQKNLKILIIAAGLALAPCIVLAAEVDYYISIPKGTKVDDARLLKTAENGSVYVPKEPVARVKDSDVKEAVVVRESVEILDEDDPVSEVFRVKLVLSETDQAKLAQVMDQLCKTNPGVHIVVDDVLVDYRPFALCGHFAAEVTFTSKGDAETFAKKISPKAVRFVDEDKEG